MLYARTFYYIASGWNVGCQNRKICCLTPNIRGRLRIFVTKITKNET
nr:MAG TPA: antimicrobial protein [Caudoviricetes sp.]